MATAWDENDMDSFKKNALHICKEFLAGAWLKLETKDFQFARVKGGLSNMLYLCSMEKPAEVNEPRRALLRISGPIKKDMETIIQETVVFAMLAERRLGPKLYGIFENGRLEEYIPSTHMSSDEVKSMFIPIAKETAKIHALEVPMRKHPKKLLNLTEEWLDILENTFINEKESNPDSDANWKRMIYSKELRKELQWTSKLVDELDSRSVVFCENDLHGGNILLRTDIPEGSSESRILIIDYEYATYNHRGYDLAGLFFNSATDYNTPEYPHYRMHFDAYPTKSEQEPVIDAYLEQMAKEVVLPETFRFEEEKQKLLKEIEVCLLLYTLTPIIWSFKMAVDAKKDDFSFGFVEYGESSAKFYWKFKEEYLANENK